MFHFEIVSYGSEGFDEYVQLHQGLRAQFLGLDMVQQEVTQLEVQVDFLTISYRFGLKEGLKDVRGQDSLWVLQIALVTRKWTLRLRK